MWEGIGVVSFLLISFWYTRIQAVKSAIQALTMNRVGDMMLSIGLFGMFALFGNLDYSTVFSLSPYVNEISITIIGILLFIGATAKSAQIPLHVWLPGSMEGKTKINNNLILFSALCASLLVIFIRFEYESLFEVSFYLSAANFIKPRGLMENSYLVLFKFIPL